MTRGFDSCVRIWNSQKVKPWPRPQSSRAAAGGGERHLVIPAGRSRSRGVNAPRWPELSTAPSGSQDLEQKDRIHVFGCSATSVSVCGLPCQAVGTPKGVKSQAPTFRNPQFKVKPREDVEETGILICGWWGGKWYSHLEK